MRGQAHTLEAIVASLLLLSSLVFALQMTAVTPLSASTSSQHIENQQEAVGTGVLASAAQNDSLKPAVLYFNNSSEQFHGADDTSNAIYTSSRPNNTLARMLERSFGDEGIAYNVYFRFVNPSGDIITRRYIYSGVPTDNAVAASYTVSLMDDDHLYNADETRNATQLGDENVTYPISDTGGNLYNTVKVEVVAWRI